MSRQDWLDRAAAYVLGALDEEERIAFEDRLAVDPELREEVRSYAEVVPTPTPAVTPVQPPSHLREKILSQVRSETPSAPEEAARTPQVKPLPPRSNPIPWVLFAASLALAVAFALATRVANDRALTAESALQTAESALQSALDENSRKDELLSTFLGPNVRTASLSSTGEAPSAHLFWNAENNQVMVAAFNLPPAPSGRVYQLWGIADGEDPVSLGLFQTGEDGTALAVQPVPPGLSFTLSAVTEEPDGGSPQPTTTPFLVGEWSAAP